MGITLGVWLPPYPEETCEENWWYKLQPLAATLCHKAVTNNFPLLTILDFSHPLLASLLP